MHRQKNLPDFQLVRSRNSYNLQRLRGPLVLQIACFIPFRSPYFPSPKRHHRALASWSAWLIYLINDFSEELRNPSRDTAPAFQVAAFSLWIWLLPKFLSSMEAHACAQTLDQSMCENPVFLTDDIEQGEEIAEMRYRPNKGSIR